jgi:hypothetical protein
MASTSEMRIKTFKADRDLSSYQYRLVKIGTDEKHIDYCGANGRSIGVLLNKPDAAEEDAEIALIGGGGLLAINETVTAGKYLTSTSTGLGEVVDAAGEHISAIAMDDGVQNDVIAVELTCGEAYESDA